MTMANIAIKRKCESNKEDTIPTRSDRLFAQDGYWYFRTREGLNIGPFDNAQEAEQGVSDFMDFVNNAEPSMIKRVTDYVNRAA